MAGERATQAYDKRPDPAERTGPGGPRPAAGGVVVGVALLAAAILAFFLLNRQASDDLPLSGAAATVTDSASRTIGDAAARAAKETARRGQPAR